VIQKFTATMLNTMLPKAMTSIQEARRPRHFRRPCMCMYSTSTSHVSGGGVSFWSQPQRLHAP